MNAICASSINEEPYVLISREYPAHVLAIKMPLQSPSVFFFLSTSIASSSRLVVREGCEAAFQHHFVPLRDLSGVNSSSPSTPAMRLLTPVQAAAQSLLHRDPPSRSGSLPQHATTPDKSKINKELSRTLSHTGTLWTLMELLAV